MREVIGVGLFWLGLMMMGAESKEWVWQVGVNLTGAILFVLGLIILQRRVMEEWRQRK